MIATCRVKGLGHFRAEGLAKLLSRSTHAKAGRDENPVLKLKNLQELLNPKARKPPTC